MERIRHWLVERLPAGLLWQPAEWALAFLVAVSGTLTLTGLRVSTTANEALPDPVYYAWGALMLAGGVALAAGLASTRRVGQNFVVTRVPAYRLGLRLVGLTEGVYAFLVVWVAGLGGVQAAIGAGAVAALCFFRLLTVGGAR